MGDDYSVRLLRRLTHTPLALKDTLGDKLYDAYISSMLTPFSIDEVRLMERKTLYQVSTKCGDDKTFYRFRFNGQEKDNELKGKGNVNTAEFWQYDTRTGRRWNIDPVDQVDISNYAVMEDNPVLVTDPDGDCPACVIGILAFIGYMTNAAPLEAPTLDREGDGEKMKAAYREYHTGIVTNSLPLPKGSGKAASPILNAMEKTVVKKVTEKTVVKKVVTEAEKQVVKKLGDNAKEKLREQFDKNKSNGNKAEQLVRKQVESELKPNEVILDKPFVKSNKTGKGSYLDILVGNTETKKITKSVEVKSGNAKTSTGQDATINEGATVNSKKYPEFKGAEIPKKTLEVKRVN